MSAAAPMTSQLLDRPVWHSLQTRHAGLALKAGRAARYPAEVAPFFGVEGDEVLGDDFEALVPRGETVLLLGPKPSVPAGVELSDAGHIVQMVCDEAVAASDGEGITPLGDEHRAQVLALTALVYPHYFRPRTVELGRYFGVFEGGRLAAMAGERMGFPGYRELSAICTHPDFLGRGLARRLVRWLSHDVQQRGETPFLHVSPANERARVLYEQNGYRLRGTMPFWSLRHQLSS